MGLQTYEFGPYRLSAEQKILLRDGALVPVTPKATEVLLVLLEHAGQVVSKEEILRAVWTDTAVVEGNLTQTIFMLRKALGESSHGGAYIETVPKLGYRFVAEARNSDGAGGAASSAVVPGEGRGALSGAYRFRTAVSMAGLALVLGATGFGIWRHEESRAEKKAGVRRIQSIAVLPLANLSGDASQQYFVDGMTDELITTLAEMHTLLVTSHTSVMRYRNTSEPLRQIGRDLGVDALLEGAVARSGDQVRISVRLVDAASDHQLWATNYERPLSDALVMQADIAREIVREIQTELEPGEEARLRARGRLDPQAQEEYLLGRFYWNRRNPADLRMAMQHFHKAVAIDPSYARAFAGLADCYLVWPIYESTSAREAIAHAKADAQEALRLDNSLAEAHTSLAYALEYEWDFAGAEREYLRAISLRPSYATAHQWYGELLRFMNRQDAAIAQSKIAMRLDPLSPVISMEAALPFYYRGQYEEAIRRLRQTVEASPGFGPAYGNLGWVLEQTGAYTKALEAFEQARERGLAESPWILGGMGWAYARLGDRRNAGRDLAELESLARHSDEPTIQVALVFLALGEKKEALRWYERAFQRHDWWLLSAGVDPKLAPLRDDPEFQQLLDRIGLREMSSAARKEQP